MPPPLLLNGGIKMFAKVCDICNDIITRGNDKIVNGDKILIHLTTETEKTVGNFDICYECFSKHFQNTKLLEKIDDQIIKELNEK